MFASYALIEGRGKKKGGVENLVILAGRRRE